MGGAPNQALLFKYVFDRENAVANYISTSGFVLGCRMGLGFKIPLVHRQELCERLPHIPHGCASSVYRSILDGGSLPEPREIDLDGPLRSALDNDDGAVEADPLHDDAPLASAHMDGSEDNPGVFSDSGGELDLEEILAQMIDEDDGIHSGEPEVPDAGDVHNAEPVPAMPSHPPEIVEEPVPPPPAALPKRRARDTTRHPERLVDIRGDGKAMLKYDTKLHILSAHCNHTDHGPHCRVNRTLKPRDSNPAQGRPLGLLMAWLNFADAYATKGTHMVDILILEVLLKS